MSRSHKYGLALGTWLRANEFCSADAYPKIVAFLRLTIDYLWLLSGLAAIWIGTIGLYVIHATGMPSFLSSGVFIGPFCLYRFWKLRMSSAIN